MKLKKLAGVLVVFVAFGLTGVKAAGIMSIPFVTVETPNYGAPTLGGGEGCFPCYYCPWNENYYKEGAANTPYTPTTKTLFRAFVFSRMHAYTAPRTAMMRKLEDSRRKPNWHCLK